VPLYEYECPGCGHRFEKIEPVTAPHRQKCPKCKALAERLLAAPAIQFKGSGWYVTDYARKSGGEGKAEKAEKSEEAGTKETKETKEASETKPAKETRGKSEKRHKH
jgi:putative FmdB family regulatory protein